MKNILQVDSSILGDASVSRRLTSAIVERLLVLAPAAHVVHRDVAAAPLPQYTGAVAFTRAQPADAQGPSGDRDVALLDAALEEVLAADTIVIGAPMYNFGIPSQLKAWLDAICVAGRTFGYGANGPEGLLGGRRVIIASARGGMYGADTPMAPLDHQETYLRGFFAFLGIRSIEVVRAEGIKVGPDGRQRALDEGLQQASLLEAA
jgi:FMN-dependent NADH-azoreductase